MTHLILWDIDHTLIENSGVSKEIYGEAFRMLADIPALYPAQTDGRTDRAIMRGMFNRHGLSVPSWDRIERALEAAGAARRARLSGVGYLLPGAQETVVRLREMFAVVQTVLTGNIRPNAFVKLDTFGIADHFDLAVGAYGSDHESRVELVDIARRRAGQKYGQQFDLNDCIVIGDTPRDVAAGRGSGAFVLAVASGVFGSHELAAAGADLVLPDLVDAERALSTILSRM